MRIYVDVYCGRPDVLLSDLLTETKKKKISWADIDFILHEKSLRLLFLPHELTDVLSDIIGKISYLHGAHIEMGVTGKK